MNKSIKTRPTSSRGKDEKIIEGQGILGIEGGLFPLPWQPAEGMSPATEYQAFVEKIIPVSGIVVRVQEDLYKLISDCGLQVLQAILEKDRERLCGQRYRHDPRREASRYGYGRGRVVCGGRTIKVKRPRVRSGRGEEALPSYEIFSRRDPLDERTMKQIVLGVTTRRYGESLERMGSSIESSSTSKSSVSRRFVRMTTQALQATMAEPIGSEVAAVMIDGIEVDDHVILVALGIDETGRKRLLGMREGSTENATVCRSLLSELIERGLSSDRAILFVIDGGKGIRKALRESFGANAVIQRCQVHKKRNVMEHLAPIKRPWVRKIMSEAYLSSDADKARKSLLHLAEVLETQYPSAAASVRDGLDETLTVIRLGLPQPLRSSLCSTNPIENLNGSIRRVSRNVKRWRGGQMILRWSLIGGLEAQKSFRRLRGYKQMSVLTAALRREGKEIEKVA